MTQHSNSLMANNNLDRQKPLTIYSASAGSGKTFTLALEYLKLLIEDPQNYQYILAVTFTNKATDEMKTRILSRLYSVANHMPDPSGFTDALLNAFPTLSDTDVSDRARQALDGILNHYNWFRVETIDSFFQSVLRNLSLELGLNANLTVGLNDQEVEEQAVDNVIENIKSEKDPVLVWIMDFIDQQMADNKAWNVIDKIKAFSQNLSTEIYKDNARAISQFQQVPNNAIAYKKLLRTVIENANKEMAEMAQRFNLLKRQHGIDDADFIRGKSIIPGYFAKLAEGYQSFTNSKVPAKTILNCIDDPTKMVKASTLHTGKGEIITTAFHELLAEAEEKRAAVAPKVVTASLIMSNLNELMLLERIDQEVKLINEENNSYLLSSTQKLLNNLIEDSDAPFIYEKIGGQVRYIMIDEFQDTSLGQWENFRVLLRDCISHYAGSLIVGDVKQSIYRWRSGDWTILQQLSTSDDSRIKNRSLDTNYRSEANIVRFNNVFFRLAGLQTKLLGEEKIDTPDNNTGLMKMNENVTDIFNKAKQKVKSSKQDSHDGYVRVKLVKESDDETMFALVGHTIEELLERHVPQKDIAVLVRKKNDIKALAEHFQQVPIHVGGQELFVNLVSDEAFRLDASSAVRAIINAMICLVHPNDELTLAALKKTYRVTRRNDKEELPEKYLVDPNHFLSLSLSDMAVALYETFHLENIHGQSSYICALMDAIGKFSKNHVPDLSDFLDEWDANISSKSIHSDEVNGIRMITIHKSKGLEFRNVIIPYCDWMIEDSRSLIWVSNKRPFDQMPIVPVNLNSDRLMHSYFKDDYFREHTMCLIDNLNLLYVAFTRAGRNLFVYGRARDKRYASYIIGQVIRQMENDEAQADEELQTSFRVEDSVEDGSLTFTMGEIYSPEDKKKDKVPNVFEPDEGSVHVDFAPNDYKPDFRQSNDSAAFVLSEDEQQKRNELEYIKTGNVIHKLLSDIRYIDDVERVINRLDYDGCLYGNEMSREKLLDYIRERMAMPQIADWFSTKWTVINERNILIKNSNGSMSTQRPDRVITDGQTTIVIDFKTGEPEREHYDQVRGYVYQLRQMGFRHVEGYLWYLKNNDIQTVEK